jgi:hypothetical protein
MHLPRLNSLFATATFIALSACSHAPSDAKLVGEWYLDGIAKITVSYSKDHTFAAAGSQTGTWRIDGNQLITTIKNGTDIFDGHSMAGKEFRQTIVSLDGTTLTLKDSDRVEIYKRLK